MPIRTRATMLILVPALAWIGCGGGNSTPSGSQNPPPPLPQLMLSRISPSRVNVGVPQSEIILWGENFTFGSMVFFDGAAGNFIVKDDHEIDLLVSTSLTQTAGNHTVQVEDSRNGNSAVFNYSIYQSMPGPQEFLAQPSTYVGNEQDPTGDVLADFNGDGMDDLILGSNSSQALYILHGQADGTFSPPTILPFTLSGTLDGLVAGDLNGDGHPDLVVLATDVDGVSTRITTLLNDGVGNLTPGSSTTVPTLSFAAPVMADFRGTGKLDLVVASTSLTGDLLLFPGQGDGGFGSPIALGLPGVDCIQVAVGDFNGDGLPDLVYEANNYPDIEIRVLSNLGNGTFADTRPASFANLSNPFAVADFNNDHKSDIVFQSKISPTTPIVVMLGQSNGTFVPGTSIPKNQVGSAVAIITGDLDGDGNMDVIANTNLGGPDQAAIFWGDGTGNFSPPQFVTSETSFFPLVGDVNGDGIQDLVQTARFSFAGATVGRRDRHFPSPAVVLPAVEGGLSVGDVLGDGSQDLLAAGNITDLGPFDGSIYHIEPNGTFNKIGSTPPRGFLLADLDGDGIADLIGFPGGNVTVWKGDGTGDYSSLSPVFQFALNEATDIEVRDVDHDGIPDIILSGMILYGKGGMKFTPVMLPAGTNEAFAVGDFDGDRNLDIATPNGIMYGMGNQTFSAPAGSVPGFTQDPYGANWVVADVNGDGMDDLVFADGSHIVIALSAGRSGLFIDQILSAEDNVGFLGIADFNGDGRLDIVATTLSAEDAVLFTNDGKGGYLFSSCGIGASTFNGLVADLNGDGRPDLAIVDFPLDFRPKNLVIALHK